MLVRLLIGGVTLAAAGYVAKEYCEENGCPWDETTISYRNEDDDLKEKKPQSFKKAKQFHKQKKALYKDIMEEYKKFLSKYSLEDDTLNPETKIAKQKFTDENVDEEVKSLMDKVLKNMEILNHNLSIGMQYFRFVKVKEEQEKAVADIQIYAKALYDLAHVELFKDGYFGQQFQKDLVLEKLVEAMALCMQKDICYEIEEPDEEELKRRLNGVKF